uniref:F-box domain-containing protein n=1 Tax=Quercus lobata TaxID=97700 RepID=A0A7N2R9S7_QUELO
MGKRKSKGKKKAVRSEKQSSSLTVDSENSITNQEQTDVFSKFSEEILLEVLSRLPAKDVCNIRSVSKGINNLTRRPDFAAKHFRNCKTNFAGFFHQSFGMEWNGNGGTTRVSDCLDVVEVVDSCNGLLLCCIYTGICVYSGMAMFKTTCSKDDEYCSMLSVFSSETGEWKEFEERLPPLCHYSVMGSKVVCSGSLFWDCLEGHILVFHLNKKSKSQNCYELIEAPRAPLGRSLWKSNDKLFCYCHGFNDEFPVWSLCVSDEEELEWKVEGCKEFEMLTEDVSNGVANSLTNIRVQKPRVKFNTIGFNHESNVIYAWKTGFIIRYEFTERNLETYNVACDCLPSRILPYVHNFAPIQIANMKEEEGYVDVKKNKEKRKGKHVAPRSQRTK